MDAAKQAIKDLTSRAGKHDTTVHESVNPAVTNEHVTPTRHEEAQTVVDREVHQDHHHTTIQPVKDREVLPEEHSHNRLATQHKEYNHNDESRTKERLATEAAQFRNTTETGSTRETASTAPTVGGEHVHHHVHETIQPVIQKETIQPSVVHTTVPVHELHQNEAKHHATSALPAVSLADFKQQGGSLTGRSEKVDRFAGEPRGETATNHSHGLGSSGTTGTHGSSTTVGPHDSNLANKADPRVDSDLDGSRNAGAAGVGSTTGRSGVNDSSYGTRSGGVGSTGRTGDSGYDTRSGGVGSTGRTTDSGYGSTGSGLGSSGTTTGTGNQTGSFGHFEDSKTKPSLMDKLNPTKDADRDGKKGLMD